jgi:hypothetical protein
MYGELNQAHSREEILGHLLANGVTVVVWDQFGIHPCAQCGQRQEEPLQKPEKLITEELVRMGFRQGQTGFNHIVKAIACIVRIPPGQPIRVTSDIYPQVAAEGQTSAGNVERTIRNAIESVWKRSNLQTLEELYPYPCDNQNGRPTNAEFLINMAGRFRRI